MFIQPRNSTISQTSQLITSTNTPIKSGSLTLTSSKQNHDNTIIVYVRMQASSAKPYLAQIELGYDQRVLQGIQIKPGDFFNAPHIPLQSINNSTGRLSLAVTCAPERINSHCIQEGENTLAEIHFKQITPSDKALSKIYVLPKTILRDANNKEIPVQKYDTEVQLQSIINQTATQSAN